MPPSIGFRTDTGAGSVEVHVDERARAPPEPLEDAGRVVDELGPRDNAVLAPRHSRDHEVYTVSEYLSRHDRLNPALDSIP